MKNKILVSDNEKEDIMSLYGLIGEDKESRVISQYHLYKNDWRKYKSQGLTPYMLDMSVDGDYKLIEVKESKSMFIERGANVGRIFLISEENMPIIEKVLNNINEITKLYLESIRLHRSLLIGSISKIVDK